MATPRHTSDSADRRPAEERYEQAFHQSPYPMLIIDPATRRVFDANDAAVRKYGYSREQFIDLDMLELRPPEDGPFLLEYLAEGLPDFDRGVTRHRLADGTLIDVEVTGQAFEVAGRKLRMVYVDDVTEQRKAAAALAQSEAETRALIEAIPDLIFRVSADGRYLSFTPAPGFAPAMPPEEFLGRALEDTLPAEVAERARAALVRTLQTGEPQLFDYELVVDGEAGIFEARMVPISTTGEVMAIVRDVTEARAAHESLAHTAAELEQRAAELERSNADLAQFAYVVSHDLSEPLRMIATYVNLFGRRYEGRLDDDADEFISHITGGVERMQVMIRDLLSYSRAGAADRETEPVDLGRLLEEVVSNLADIISDGRAVLEAGELPTVIGDGSQLRQVLQNLISNGLKFVPPGAVPHLRIESELSEGMWTISVIDDGVGIEPRYRSRIFIPFRRLHNQDEYPGTGVGLAIAKRIVERHGGTIWVESDAGGGSVFSFTLPAGDIEASS